MYAFFVPCEIVFRSSKQVPPSGDEMFVASGEMQRASKMWEEKIMTASLKRLMISFIASLYFDGSFVAVQALRSSHQLQRHNLL
jgi:hypothetical protein